MKKTSNKSTPKSSRNRNARSVCRYKKYLQKMPPLHHSTDERKAYGLEFNPCESGVAKYLLRHTGISFGECFSVIPEAYKAGVIIYDPATNRYSGCKYKGPFPTPKEAGIDRILARDREDQLKKDKSNTPKKNTTSADHSKAVKNRNRRKRRKRNRKTRKTLETPNRDQIEADMPWPWPDPEA